MTRRERLERKLEKRAEWSEKAERRAEQRNEASHRAVDGIPFGQPILIGHHSEKRHRAALHRAQTNATKAYEERQLAEHHRSKADGLEMQLDRTVFSDDPDAIEQLQAKVAALRAENDRDKAMNAHYRKHKTMKGHGTLSDERAAKLDADILATWDKRPVPQYRFSNRSATIRKAEERIKWITQQQARAQKAESSEGGFIIEGTGDYIRVTFAEKPERSVLNALREAGYRWGGGSWTGERVKLPAELAQEAAE